MQLDKLWIEKHHPCAEALDFTAEERARDASIFNILDFLVKNEKYQWAEWTLVRCLSQENNVKFAVACAKSVLPIFEKAFPNDSRPRKAIEAAESNAANAADAANAAYAAAYAAANAADAAAYAAYAANAAYAAAHAAAYAAYAAAYAAYAAAYAAADAAAYAAAHAAAYLRLSNLQFGIVLLRGQEATSERERLDCCAKQAHENNEDCGREDCQNCCPHDERDHGICLDCAHEE